MKGHTDGGQYATMTKVTKNGVQATKKKTITKEMPLHRVHLQQQPPATPRTTITITMTRTGTETTKRIRRRTTTRRTRTATTTRTTTTPATTATTTPPQPTTTTTTD